MKFLIFIKLNMLPIMFPFLSWKLFGKENKKNINNGQLIVCNHRTHLDVFQLGFIFFSKKIYFMATPVIFSKNKLFSRFMKAIGAVEIGDKNASLSSLSVLQNKIGQGDIACVFPEGRLNNKDEMLPFGLGASMILHNTRCSFVPIWIGDRKRKIFSRTKINLGSPVPYEEWKNYDGQSVEEIKNLTAFLREKIEELRIR